MKPMKTLPALPVYPVPDDCPPVVPENVETALRCLGGALEALNLGGYTVEHHKGQDGQPQPYGLIHEATTAVLAYLYPDLDAELIMMTRLNLSALGDIPAAVEAVRRGL